MKRLRLRDPLALVLAPCLIAGGLIAFLPNGNLTPTAARTIPAAVRRPWWPRLLPSSAPTARPLRRSIAAVAEQYGVSASTLRRVMRYARLARKAWPSRSALVLAVIATESRGYANAVNENSPDSYDLGAMQVDTSEFAATGLTWRTAMNPARNIRAGVRILRADLAEYRAVPYALEAYNGGGLAVGVDWLYQWRVLRGWLPAIRAAEAVA